MNPRHAIAIAAATTLLAGCVTVTNPANYRPQSANLTQDYYQCTVAATGTAGAVAWNQYGGSGNVGARTDPNLLLQCMQARDYRVRKATTVEIIVGIVTSPLWFPLEFLGVLADSDQYLLFGGSAAD